MQHATRKGFTLIEVLAVAGIIGLLVALLIPAAQSAREAARRVQCSNNLKQIGIAIHSYSTTYEVFPSGQGAISQSLFVASLPYLDLTAQYNGFNFDVELSSPSNHTAYNLRPAILICPSDPIQPRAAFTNYAGNAGDAYYERFYNGVFATSDSPWDHYLGPRDIPDGLSSTAAAAEWLVGSQPPGDERRSLFRPSSSSGGTTSSEGFASRCSSLNGFLPSEILKGDGWSDGIWRKTLYDHFLTVNRPSCVNTKGSRVAGACTAGSFHPGGATVLFSDGRVTFVHEGITSLVWRALGTRNGGEIISSNAY